MNNGQLQQIENQAEEIISATVSESAATDAFNDLCFVLGGLDAINTIATNLTSGLIIKLQQIRDTHGYRAAGYTRFDQFMDNFPRSPMSYKRFNYIENVFKNLGADVFDLTSPSGLSMRQLKLIGKGNVEIDNGMVRVRTEDGSVEIEISNRRQWLESLTALADANADKSIKLERQKEKIDKHTEKVRELYNEIDQVKASKAAEIGQDPHSLALAQLCFAFAALREAAAELPLMDRAARKDNVLEIIANQSRLTSGSYRTDGTEKPLEPVIEGDTFDESLENFLDQVDLTGGDDNDAELTAKM